MKKATRPTTKKATKLTRAQRRAKAKRKAAREARKAEAVPPVVRAAQEPKDPVIQISDILGKYTDAQKVQIMADVNKQLAAHLISVRKAAQLENDVASKVFDTFMYHSSGKDLADFVDNQFKKPV